MALWQARRAFLKIRSSITVSLSTGLWDAMSSATSFEAVCKDVEFVEPERTTEIVKLLGATSGNQNQELNVNAPEDAELSGTLILSPESGLVIDLEAFKLTATTGVTATDTETSKTIDKRYNYASAPPSAGVAVALRFTDGSNMVTFLMNNASIETLGGVSIDADGHAEQEFRIKSAADDTYKEWAF